nr:immunoglobulin light chain junction region [Macaca mulatta]MOX08398.1 immunoglobulin light chain junction region [Macaca mulatta]MOX08584.1 immunoglobulin light chain junction region [Macaca mulatta]MOX11058.1 immunoglobulin light chain junction region [Macaca mulatta]
CQQHSSYPTF